MKGDTTTVGGLYDTFSTVDMGAVPRVRGGARYV